MAVLMLDSHNLTPLIESHEVMNNNNIQRNEQSHDMSKQPPSSNESHTGDDPKQTNTILKHGRPTTTTSTSTRTSTSTPILSALHTKARYLSIQVTSCLGGEQITYVIRVRSLQQDHFVYKSYREVQMFWRALHHLVVEHQAATAAVERKSSSMLTWLATTLRSFPFMSHSTSSTTRSSSSHHHHHHRHHHHHEHDQHNNAHASSSSICLPPTTRIIQRLNVFLQRMVRHMQKHTRDFKRGLGLKILDMLSEFLQFHQIRASLDSIREYQPTTVWRLSMSLPDTSMFHPSSTRSRATRCRSRVFTEVDFKSE